MYQSQTTTRPPGTSSTTQQAAPQGQSTAQIISYWPSVSPTAPVAAPRSLLTIGPAPSAGRPRPHPDLGRDTQSSSPSPLSSLTSSTADTRRLSLREAAPRWLKPPSLAPDSMRDAPCARSSPQQRTSTPSALPCIMTP
ncbi:hypothetical protein CDD83_8067 [Cordyceps sp. RAO-2017]|nr:hypothetical protein CDD83_8067 [Cordyceps sp. RAO-2017]